MSTLSSCTSGSLSGYVINALINATKNIESLCGSTTITTPLTVNGLLTANNGIAVTGGLNVDTLGATGDIVSAGSIVASTGFSTFGGINADHISVTNVSSTNLSVNGTAQITGGLTCGSLSLSQPITGYTSASVVPVSGQVGYIWKYTFTQNTITSGAFTSITNLSIGVGTWIIHCRMGIHNTPSNFCNLTSVRLSLLDSSGNYYDNYEDNGTTHAITSTQYFTPSITATINYDTGRAYGVYYKIIHTGTSTNVIYGDNPIANQLWAVRIA